MDVDQTNFREIFPGFVQLLAKSSFVSIDAEFSGLGPPPNHETAVRSLFDDAEIRYKKAKIASCYFICQFGITLFRRKDTSNSYHADCYNFYLYPASYGDFARLEPVCWELSSVLFLREHKFDFDRCFEKGIPYMNKRKTEDFKTYLKTRTSGGDNTFSHVDDGVNYTKEFPAPKYPENLPIDLSPEELIDYYRGFSTVIDELIKARKPIVGHNMYLDLVFLYNHLYDDLPETYAEFKTQVHQIFPFIFDTKALANEMKQLFCKRNPQLDYTYLNNTSLPVLYKNTSNPPGLTKPIILLSPASRVYLQALQQGKEEDLEKLDSSQCHQAGFDACVTGALFSQLAYIMWQHELSGLSLPETNYCENLIDRFSAWINYVNIGRAQITSMNLAGPDPPSHRPDWIFIHGGVKRKARNSEISSINLKTIIRQLSAIGDCEGIFVGQDKKKALVACCAMKTSIEAQKFLKKNGYNISVVPIHNKNWSRFELSWKPIFAITATVWTLFMVSMLKVIGDRGIK